MRDHYRIGTLVLAAFFLWQCSADMSETPAPTPYNFPDIPLFRDIPVDAENPVTVEGVQLGRHLFFDPILSKDSTLSCSGCHEPERSFSAPQAVSPGVGGALGRRNAMTLVNLAWYEAFNWDGLETEIRDQNIHPVADPVEMQMTWPDAVQRLKRQNRYKEMFEAAFPGREIDRFLVTKALEQFQMTLISYNSPFDLYMREEGTVSASVLRGFEVFRTERGDCFHCHSETNSPELFTTTRLIFTNNGMDSVEVLQNFVDKGRGDVTGNPEDNGRFKIPTLRNLVYSAPYMHDGRFQTLEEVVEMYNRGPFPSPSVDQTMLGDAEKRLRDFGHWGLNLTDQEKEDLVNFLRSLSDESFITDPAFQTP